MDPNQQPSDTPPTDQAQPVVSPPADVSPSLSVPPQPAVTPPPMSDGAPTPAPVQPAGEDPGQTLAIVGLVTGFLLTPLVGFVVCIIAKNKSKAAGYKNTPAIIGEWVFGVIMVLIILLFAIAFIGALTSGGTSN